MTEDGRQKTEDGRRKTEDGRQMTEDGRRKKVGSSSWPAFAEATADKAVGIDNYFGLRFRCRGISAWLRSPGFPARLTASAVRRGASGFGLFGRKHGVKVI